MLPRGTEFAVFPFLGQETSIDICPPKWKPAGFQESGFTYYFDHVMWRVRTYKEDSSCWRLFAGDRKTPFEALESLWKMFHWFVIFLLHYIWMWVLNKFSYLSLTVTTWKTSSDWKSSLRMQRQTAAKKSLWRWISDFSNFIAFIPMRWIFLM